jgi:aminoglycoside 6'-N-acetyltransferase
MYLFMSESVLVRKMNINQDKSLILQWLTDARVLEFAYGEKAPWNMQKVEEEFGQQAEGGDIVTACMIEYDTQTIGYIQYYPLEVNSYRFNNQIRFEEYASGYGVDLFIGIPELWGKGLGTEAIRGMKDYLIDKLGATVVCADPMESNLRSVRCWLKAGFTPVGFIQNYDYPEKRSILMAARQ